MRISTITIKEELQEISENFEKAFKKGESYSHAGQYLNARYNSLATFNKFKIWLEIGYLLQKYLGDFGEVYIAVSNDPDACVQQAVKYLSELSEAMAKTGLHEFVKPPTEDNTPV